MTGVQTCALPISGSSEAGFGISIDPVSMTLKSMLSQPVSVWHQVDTQGSRGPDVPNNCQSRVLRYYVSAFVSLREKFAQRYIA